ncbi:MAG TPA: DUF6249 domain-containing protein [Alphaproteobacteria bacterium]|nr:DUF6249 domain-containing protein [Alphaproteobacteria bacterium]
MHGWYYNGPDMFWIFIAIIVVSSMLFGYLRSRSRDETIRDLAERGQPIPPQMFDRPGGRSGLLIGGLVMLFIGIALSGFMFSMGGMHGGFGREQYPVFVGLFPGGIGLALLLSYFLLGSGRSGGGH